MIDKSLIVRNTVETVTDEELDELISSSETPSVYCGYETSGPVHVGHMVTATKLLDFQNAGFNVKILFADVHTQLNRKGSEEWVDKMIEYWTHCFKALGLTEAEYVRGSSFQLQEEYIKDVLALSLKTTMKRAMRSMQEVARDIDNAHVSQMIYPLMQAVDIKALGVDVSYGGIEQRKIQMLAREYLPDLGYKKPICIHTPLICSLGGPDCKMSSSKPDTLIAIDEDPKSISKKIGKAYCPPEVEDNPVLDISKHLIFTRVDSIKVERPEKFGGNAEYKSYEELEKAYLEKELHPADLKTAVGTALGKVLEPVRAYFSENNVSLPESE